MTRSLAQGLRAFLVLGSAVALAGCASTRQTIGGWLGAATPTPVARGATAPGIYYAAIDGLKVYSEPSASSPAIGHLSLHERVTRLKLDRGYAYVESGTGQKGWVNNAQLIWRLPRPSAIEGAATAEPQAEEPQAQEPQTEEPETAEPETEEPAGEAPQEPQVPEPTATATPETESSNPAETPSGVAPSIFDAY